MAEPKLGNWASGEDHGIHCWWDLIRSKQLSSGSVYRAYVFAGFSGHCNSIHNIFALLKKENVALFPLSWGHNKYADEYFQSSWGDVALEVTVSSVKDTGVTYKTHSS